MLAVFAIKTQRRGHGGGVHILRAVATGPELHGGTFLGASCAQRRVRGGGGGYGGAGLVDSLDVLGLLAIGPRGEGVETREGGDSLIAHFVFGWDGELLVLGCYRLLPVCLFGLVDFVLDGELGT